MSVKNWESGLLKIVICAFLMVHCTNVHLNLRFLVLLVPLKKKSFWVDVLLVNMYILLKLLL